MQSAPEQNLCWAIGLCIDFSLEPFTYIMLHRRYNLVTSVITLEHNIACTKPQTFRVISHAFRRVKLIACAGKMKYRSLSWFVELACLPIPRHTATDADNTAQVARMCADKAVI